MRFLAIGTGCAVLCLAATAVHTAAQTSAPNDPTHWSCAPGQTCSARKTDGMIPDTAHGDELLHVVKGARFLIQRTERGEYQFELKGGEWLPAFENVALTWVREEEIMEDGACPAGSKHAARAATTPLIYSRFEGDVLLHWEDGVLDKHTLQIFPIDTGNQADRRYCIRLAGKGNGKHDGAVHGDN